MTNRLLTTPEAAELAGVREATVRQWIHRGKLRARKHGRDWQIRADDLADAQTDRRVRRPR